MKGDSMLQAGLMSLPREPLKNVWRQLLVLDQIWYTFCILHHDFGHENQLRRKRNFAPFNLTQSSTSFPREWLALCCNMGDYFFRNPLTESSIDVKRN